MNVQEYRALQKQSWAIDNQQFADSFVNPRLEGVPRQTAEKYNELVNFVMDTLQPSETKNAVLLQIKQAKDAHIAQWFSEQPKPQPKKD
jgi:hypothetical protein